MVHPVRRMLERLFGGGRPGDHAGLWLGAFGKHPGWDDHIDDPGLDTDPLADLKTGLYVRGIGADVDAGVWEQLDDAARLPGFRHQFVWHAGTDLILGRMWSSLDRKGRSRYPMVVCAHCAGLPLAWVLAEVPPLLAELQDRCQAADTADAVRALLDGYRATLRQRAEGVGAVEAFHLPADAIRLLAACDRLGPGAEGIRRILYHADEQMKGSWSSAGALTGPAPAGHMRVPPCGETWAEVVRRWLGCMRRLVGPDVPVLLLSPLGEDWLDVLVGAPGPQALVCLRATPRAIPLTSEIPYTMDAAFRERADRIVAGDIVPAREGAALPRAWRRPHSARVTGSRIPVCRDRGCPESALE